jgi:hypothetical protein
MKYLVVFLLLSVACSAQTTPIVYDSNTTEIVSVGIQAPTSGSLVSTSVPTVSLPPFGGVYVNGSTAPYPPTLMKSISKRKLYYQWFEMQVMADKATAVGLAGLAALLTRDAKALKMQIDQLP